MQYMNSWGQNRFCCHDNNGEQKDSRIKEEKKQDFNFPKLITY